MCSPAVAQNAFSGFVRGATAIATFGTSEALRYGASNADPNSLPGKVIQTAAGVASAPSTIAYNVTGGKGAPAPITGYDKPPGSSAQPPATVNPYGSAGAPQTIGPTSVSSNARAMAVAQARRAAAMRAGIMSTIGPGMAGFGGGIGTIGSQPMAYATGMKTALGQ